MRNHIRVAYFPFSEGNQKEFRTWIRFSLFWESIKELAMMHSFFLFFSEENKTGNWIPFFFSIHLHAKGSLVPLSLVVFDLKIFPCMHTLIRITYPLGGGEGRLRDLVTCSAWCHVRWNEGRHGCFPPLTRHRSVPQWWYVALSSWTDITYKKLCWPIMDDVNTWEEHKQSPKGGGGGGG